MCNFIKNTFKEIFIYNKIEDMKDIQDIENIKNNELHFLDLSDIEPIYDFVYIPSVDESDGHLSEFTFLSTTSPANTYNLHTFESDFIPNDSYLGTYSFELKPDQYTPSGSINYSTCSKNSSDTDTINVYSFALNPDENSPSGSVNYSKISNNTNSAESWFDYINSAYKNINKK